MRVRQNTRVGVVIGILVLATAAAMAQTGAPAADPVPYTEQEITFTNGSITLAGTLTLPRSKGPFPAVVLLTGSGPQNRNEELFGFKPFQVLAHHFARQGIAVLRYDDRGVGGSTGRISDSTTEDFAADALAAVALLAAREDIRPSQIGLLGHSEGAIAAAIAASRSNELAFIVLMAGSAIRGDEILRAQAGDIARAGGADPAALERILAAHRRLMDAVAANEGDAVLNERIRVLARAQIDAMPEAQRAMVGNIDKLLDAQMPAQLAAMRTPWFRFFVRFDPASALAKVTCPVFAAFGERDLQVPSGTNRAPLEAALTRAGNARVTVKVYPDANHLFIASKTGHPSEYATLEKRFVPGLLEELSGWIRSQADKR